MSSYLSAENLEAFNKRNLDKYAYYRRSFRQASQNGPIIGIHESKLPNGSECNSPIDKFNSLNLSADENETSIVTIDNSRYVSIDTEPESCPETVWSIARVIKKSYRQNP